MDHYLLIVTGTDIDEIRELQKIDDEYLKFSELVAISLIQKYYLMILRIFEYDKMASENQKSMVWNSFIPVIKDSYIEPNRV